MSLTETPVRAESLPSAHGYVLDPRWGTLRDHVTMARRRDAAGTVTSWPAWPRAVLCGVTRRKPPPDHHFGFHFQQVTSSIGVTAHVLLVPGGSR